MAKPQTKNNENQPVNVASVRQLSPFRYPGGKTWLVPYVRRWVNSLPRKPRTFVEPFAGGGILALTVAAEKLADRVVLGELDEDIASVWETILSDDAEWLCERILSFDMTRETVIHELARPFRLRRQRAFQTILRNRVQRGGILAPGASLVKGGENGKGVLSRWYPETLAKRIRAIASIRERIDFVHGDAFDLISRFASHRSAAFLIDPPYTAGGKRAGKRLYRHNELDHQRLFGQMAKVRGSVLMTYDDADEVLAMANENAFQIEDVPMKNAHHRVMREFLISNQGSCFQNDSPLTQAAYLKKQLAIKTRAGKATETLPLFEELPA